MQFTLKGKTKMNKKSEEDSRKEIMLPELLQQVATYVLSLCVILLFFTFLTALRCAQRAQRPQIKSSSSLQQPPLLFADSNEQSYEVTTAFEFKKKACLQPIMQDLSLF